MTTQPYLPPIERPAGLMLKLAYFFTRRRFGKVLAPLKIHSARLPIAFGLFYGKISELDRKLTLPPGLVVLIRQRVAAINVCSFCVDIARAIAIRAVMDDAKFDDLERYRTSEHFNEAERAALDFSSELTKDHKASPEQFERLSQHFNERQICEILWLVATEHVYNITNIGLNIHSDQLCILAKQSRK